jgi:hypothetical protein
MMRPARCNLRAKSVITLRKGRSDLRFMVMVDDDKEKMVNKLEKVYVAEIGPGGEEDAWGNLFLGKCWGICMILSFLLFLLILSYVLAVYRACHRSWVG